ncbi:MAG: DUF1540 domain-containing protein [Actinobacteria bacterium]|nr:DUF1540 domain-containing protein [Actinomycetota bacterium]
MAEKLPPVLNCIVNDCEFWGEGNMCHATSIWVGGDHPTCDTYERAEHHEYQADQASVRQCDVDICRFNESAVCHAPGINISWHSGHADCVTFEQG